MSDTVLVCHSVDWSDFFFHEPGSINTVFAL